MNSMEIVSDKLAAKRADARDRQRKSRANKKLDAIRVEQEKFTYHARYNRVVGAGELEPDVFARTDAEWLFCARRYAQAAGLRDIQQGESLNDFERRCYGAVCHFDERTKLWTLPLLNLETRKFDERFEIVLDKNINDSRFFLPEHDALIDVSALPPIPTAQPSRSV